MSISNPTSSQTGGLTYDDYARIPAEGNRHEIIGGVHYVNPSPVPYHQALSRHIQYQLYSAIELTGLGEVINAPIDLQFSENDVVQPDIVVVLKGNNIITKTRLRGVPDLLIEVLSPSTARHDEVRKKQLFEENAVPEYWVVDPKKNVVRKYTLTDGAYGEPQTCEAEITFAGPPSVTVDLQRVW